MATSDVKLKREQVKVGLKLGSKQPLGEGIGLKLWG